MGVCVETLNNACETTVDELSHIIEGDMKGIVGKHSRSGAALAAIHIEKMGVFKSFVGGTGGEGTLHLYYLNDGNGSGYIYPKRARALHFSDGSFHGSARTYKGIHFVEEIASRYGG